MSINYVAVEYVIVELEKKELCVVTQIYFALLAFTQDYVWCWGHIIKQIFNGNFSLKSTLFTFSDIKFNSLLECCLLRVNNY